MYFSTTAVLLIASITVMGLIQMYLVIEYFAGERQKALSVVADVAAGQPEGLARSAELREVLAGRSWPKSCARALRSSAAAAARW